MGRMANLRAIGFCAAPNSRASYHVDPLLPPSGPGAAGARRAPIIHIPPSMAPPPPQASPSTKTASTVLDARALARTLRRMADEIVELNDGTDDLVIVGIQRRGVQLAARLVALIAEREDTTVPQGALDITLYRDDLQTVGPRPVVGPTNIPVDIEGKHIVIVDDVLYTGRTVRAALDELADFGRPKRIALAVLIDRGGRELPIAPDIVGKKIDVLAGQRVDVFVEELDGRDAVVLATQLATREVDA